MKQRVFINCLFILLIFCYQVKAQVIVSSPIIMTGTVDSTQRIKGLESASVNTDAINYKDYYSGRLRFAIKTGSSGNTWNLNIPIAPNNYSEGMMIYFVADTFNSGSLNININGLGSVALKKQVNRDLDTNDLISNLPVLMVFDGTNFQIISELNKQCPSGFIRVNEHYCIQPVENDSSYFWPAAKYCGNINAKLCNWGQWYYACQKSGLGITDMTNNWEWVDTGANYLTWTSPPTGDTGLMVGENGCTQVQTGIVDINHTHLRAKPKTFRCCYEF